MTILAGIYGGPTYLDPIRVLSVGSHLVQALLIRSDPVPGFVNPVRSDSIQSDQGFVKGRYVLFVGLEQISCLRFLEFEEAN